MICDGSVIPMALKSEAIAFPTLGRSSSFLMFSRDGFGINTTQLLKYDPQKKGVIMSDEKILGKISAEFEQVNKEHVRMMDFFNTVNLQHEDMITAFKKVEKEHEKMTKDIAEIKSMISSVIDKLKA